jgi:hypothetical protein
LLEKTINIKGNQMNTEEMKYQKAKKRVAAIKGFYIHLIVYLVVNLMLFSINMIASPDRLWFFWPLIGWGSAVGLQALFIYSPIPRFGEDWEQRKIKEFMERGQ